VNKTYPLYIQILLALLVVPWPNFKYLLDEHTVAYIGIVMLSIMGITYGAIFTYYYTKKQYLYSLISSLIASVELKLIYTAGLTWSGLNLIPQSILTFNIIRDSLARGSFIRGNVQYLFDHYLQHPLFPVNLIIMEAYTNAPLSYIYALAGPIIGSFFGISGIYLFVKYLVGRTDYAVLSTVVLNSCVLFYNGYFLSYDRIGATLLALSLGVLLLMAKNIRVGNLKYLIPFYTLLGIGVASSHFIPSFLFIITAPLIIYAVHGRFKGAVNNLVMVAVIINIGWMVYLSKLDMTRAVKLLQNIISYFGEVSVPVTVSIYDPFYWFKYITFLSIALVGLLGVLGFLKSIVSRNDPLRSYIPMVLVIAGLIGYTLGIGWRKIYTDYSIRFIYYGYFFLAPFVVRGLYDLLRNLPHISKYVLFIIVVIGYTGAATGLHTYLFVRNYPIMSQEAINYPLNNYYASQWIISRHGKTRICVCGLKNTFITSYYGIGNISLGIDHPLSIIDRIHGGCYIVLFSNIDELPYVWWKTKKIIDDRDKEQLYGCVLCEYREYRCTVKIYDNGGIWVFKKWRLS